LAGSFDEPDETLTYRGNKIVDEWKELGGRADESSRWEGNAGSESEESSMFEDSAVSDDESDPGPVARTALGEEPASATDQAIVSDDRALRMPLRSDQAATDALNAQIRAAVQ
jgi:hypothetical protein